LSMISSVVCFLSVHDTPLSLLPQNLPDLPDLSLNFAGYLFTGAFGFQLRIIAEFPGDLLDLTLHFVKRSFALSLMLDFMVFLLWDIDLTAGLASLLHPYDTGQ
jgi:hypothetical protein